jgi:hypothetical protein
MHFVLLFLPQQNAFCFVGFCTYFTNAKRYFTNAKRPKWKGCRACFCTGKLKLKTDVYALFFTLLFWYNKSGRNNETGPGCRACFCFSRDAPGCRGMALFSLGLCVRTKPFGCIRDAPLSFFFLKDSTEEAKEGDMLSVLPNHFFFSFLFNCRRLRRRRVCRCCRMTCRMMARSTTSSLYYFLYFIFTSIHYWFAGWWRGARRVNTIFVLFSFFYYYHLFITDLPDDDEEHDTLHVLAKSYPNPEPWIINHKPSTLKH